jgi:hypothetical protein
MPLLVFGSMLDSRFVLVARPVKPTRLRKRDLVSPFRYQHTHARPIVSISLIAGRLDVDSGKQLRFTNVATASLQQGHYLLGGVREPRFDGWLAVYTHRFRAVDQRQFAFLLRNCRGPRTEFHYLSALSTGGNAFPGVWLTGEVGPVSRGF